MIFNEEFYCLLWYRDDSFYDLGISDHELIQQDLIFIRKCLLLNTMTTKPFLNSLSPWHIDVWKMFEKKYNDNFSVKFSVKLPWDRCQLSCVKIGSDKCAIRQQATTWANVDPDLCHHMASLGHNELNSHNHSWTRHGHLDFTYTPQHMSGVHLNNYLQK